MNLSFSAFQAVSIYVGVLPPLVDFPFISGKNLRVKIGCWWVSLASRETGAIERQTGVQFNKK